MAQSANVFIFMGVCGCGKTTISTALKGKIEKRFKNKIKVSFIEGDDLHSISNKNKMSKGIALNDRDRIPWLVSIRTAINRHKPFIVDETDKSRAIRHILFITCSALKYSYREILRGHMLRQLSPNVVSFIMLDGKSETLQKRLRDRQHEYMSSALLQSQMDTLQYPNTHYTENDIVIQSIEGPLVHIIQNLLNTIVRSKNITDWRKTQRVSSIVYEYKEWFLSEINNNNEHKISLCRELMELYSMNECIDDFMDICNNKESKQRIKQFLNIDTLHGMYNTAAFESIMSKYKDQSSYIFTLHCILCYFGEIFMIHSNNMDTLDSRFAQLMTKSKCIDISVFNDEEKYGIELLLKMNQDFIFKIWDQEKLNHSKKKQLLAQIIKLDKRYPGGLRMYYNNAVRLISNSANNVNPYKGWKVHTADNINIEFDTKQFHEYEDLGSTQFGKCGFILLGGGFGERLGFNGIKTGLPSEITSETSYIELYIKTLFAFQERARRDLNKPHLLLPFACTTSGSIGHNLTKQLLEDNDYFGLNLKQEQFTFLPQELVASFANNKCEFALDEKDDYAVIEKPHGHGDVHSLMFQTGTAQKWYKNGIKWIICLQDTNAVAIRSLSCALGVSVKNNFAMNSIGTPRLKGQSYGAICKLINNKQQELTVNVEYNQLHALLGDNGEGTGDDTEHSPFPANTNTLIIRSDTYCDVLSKTKGMMTEFVNPKYVDNIKRERFKKATRLECMMQDYPKLLFEQNYNENIGVTTLPKWMALQPVKKNIFDSQKEANKHQQHMAEFCAANGEASVYFLNRKYVKYCGVDLEGYDENELKMFNGINVKYGARIALLPSFGVTLHEMKERFIGKKEIKITKKSTLLLDGNIVIKKLYLDGTLVVRTGKKYGDATKIVIDGLKIENKGWSFKEIKDLKDASIHDIYKLRGYTLDKLDAKVIQFDDGKEHIISG